VVWTHEGCLDGATAALIARKAWPGVIVHYVEPARVDAVLAETFAKGEAKWVTLVDIAPSPEAFDAAPAGVRLEVIDHHETARRLGARDGVLVDERRCGSYLLWERLVAETPGLGAYEPLVRWVDDRDRWVRADPVSDELSLLYDTLGRNWYHVRFAQPPDEVPPWTPAERAILANLRDRANRRRSRTLERALELTDPEGRRVHAAVISGDASDTGHLLTQGYDYALMLNPGTGAVSLRGEGKVNLAALSERYGGGGHANAAGFVPRSLGRHYAQLFAAILGDRVDGGDSAAPGSAPASVESAGTVAKDGGAKADAREG
jgi:oligoribonuclease NrnB/cAMP/cGMP phosphodiesterase (DHH superfamily)